MGHSRRVHGAAQPIRHARPGVRGCCVERTSTSSPVDHEMIDVAHNQKMIDVAQRIRVCIERCMGCYIFKIREPIHQFMEYFLTLPKL